VTMINIAYFLKDVSEELQNCEQYLRNYVIDLQLLRKSIEDLEAFISELEKSSEYKLEYYESYGIPEDEDIEDIEGEDENG